MSETGRNFEQLVNSMKPTPQENGLTKNITEKVNTGEVSSVKLGQEAMDQLMEQKKKQTQQAVSVKGTQS